MSDAGSYRCVFSNGASSTNSPEATLTIYPDIYPRLVPLWSLAPGSRPYLTTDGSTLPNQRSIAYDAVGNKLLIVSRQSFGVYTITNAGIYVVNGDTGADLFGMNTNGIAGGYDSSAPNAFGTNLLTLNCIDIAGDGAVYACNVGASSISPNCFQLYYWPGIDRVPRRSPFFKATRAAVHPAAHGRSHGGPGSGPAPRSCWMTRPVWRARSWSPARAILMIPIPGMPIISQTLLAVTSMAGRCCITGPATRSGKSTAAVVRLVADWS